MADILLKKQKGEIMENSRFKFRVWDKVSKRYFYLELKFGDNGYNPDFIIDPVFEQCTGLKDKNGNLIYEGDILLCDRKDVECATGAEIHYKSSGVVQREKNGKYFIIGEDWYGSDITFYNECAEIIGNIHKQAAQKD